MNNNININLENSMQEENTMMNNATENNMGVIATINTESKKEADIMRNSANNDKATTIMGNKKMQRAAMMPKEELAVTDSLKLVTPNMPNFLSLVLPEEAAEELIGKKDSTARYRELNFFSPIRGMMNISNRLGGKIYARLHEDEKGQRRIEYIQKYVDNRYSPMMSLSQAGMRIAAQYDFLSKDIKEHRIRNKVASFLLNANEEYYGKFRGVLADELNVDNILNVLYEALPHLPVSSDNLSELEEETFYQSLDFHVNNLSSWMVMEHKSYYALEEKDIEELAASMEMKKLDLLKKLKQYDFLYLTPSSKGYQTNVRVKSLNGKTHTEWRYCIYKLSYFAGIEEVADNSFDMDNF